MKVIAQIDSSRVLCEVNSTELALLNGFRNQYDSGYNQLQSRQVGAECDITKMVSTSRFVRSLRSEKLQEIKAKLEKAIADIDSANEVLNGLDLFNILSDEKQIGD